MWKVTGSWYTIAVCVVRFRRTFLSVSSVLQDLVYELSSLATAWIPQWWLSMVIFKITEISWPYLGEILQVIMVTESAQWQIHAGFWSSPPVVNFGPVGSVGSDRVDFLWHELFVCCLSINDRLGPVFKHYEESPKHLFVCICACV